ncbi:MAG: hypothetical protein LUQ40_01910 [Methanomicrobiales archaeon]|nr:hypothetical protein [Methanomicrobiales archaeon]
MMRIQKNLVIFTAAALFVVVPAARCSSSGQYNGTPTVTGTMVPGTTVPVATTIVPGTTGTGTNVVPTVTGTRPSAGSLTTVNFNVHLTARPVHPAAGPHRNNPVRRSRTRGRPALWLRQVFNSPTEAKDTVTIIDSAYYPVGGWEPWNTHTTVQTVDGYWKYGTVQEISVPEWYKAKSKHVCNPGRDRFRIAVMNGSESDQNTLVINVNYSAIAAL